ncbi:hypothetical protein [Sphingopyxis sp. MWB1]|uniref:hypothetical protein n=1 Tax=Sphingopyxis sp. MWB1 TaxID=1537715 RepID=UPI00051A81E0|nr:hypothetical protein [Sphingopyxis sp. MWB1]
MALPTPQDRAIPGRRLCRLSAFSLSLSAFIFVPVAAAQDTLPPLPPGVEEIIVTAPYGEARVPAESQLDEEAIAAYGANSIGELVTQITPLTGRPDEQPIILINGERVDGAGGINGFPPEALARLAILKPEAAARYGYAPGKRVVNLVLKKQFASWQGAADIKAATAGERFGGEISTARFVIDGKARWNARTEWGQEDRLLASERGGTGPGDRLRSLLPASDSAALQLGLARPLGDYQAMFDISANRRSRQQWLGSAFPDDAGRSRALRADQDSANLALSGTLTGRISGWQSNAALRYSRQWSDNRIEEAPSAAATSRSRGDSLNGQITANKPVISLPAGPLTANLSVNAIRSTSTNRRWAADGVEGPENGFRRSQLDTRAAFVLPLSTDSAEGFSALGNLSANVATSLSFASGAARQHRYDFGLDWTPLPAIELHATASFADLIPTADQLGGPLVEDVRRIYDYGAEQFVDVIWITGGNPALRSGTQHLYSLRATLRPFGPRLSLSSDYNRQLSIGGVGAFPDFSPAVEAAFPERIRRGADGKLISVDARSISIARAIDERFDHHLTLMLSPGPARGGREADEGDPKAASPPWRTTLSFHHSWLLKSQLHPHDDLPPLDRLSGDSAQSRHRLRLQLTAGLPGMGASVDGIWQSGFRLTNPAVPDGSQDYLHPPMMLWNLRLFANPDRLIGKKKAPTWLSNLQLTLDIRNMFDGYRRVHFPGGDIPPGYRRYDADSLGRTVQLSARKRF